MWNILCVSAGNKGSNNTSNANSSGVPPAPMPAPRVLVAAVPKTIGTTIRHTGVSDSVLDADSSSTKSGRRPSVDTVSTYLSHESKDSELRASQVT
jgi:hypothetical protein